MFWYFLTAVFGVVTLVSLLAAMVPEVRARAIATAVGATALWLLVSAFFVFHVVNAGHVGLVKTWGAYTGEKEPGLVMTAPWQQLEEVRVRTQSKRILMDGRDGRGSAVSSETQPVFARVTLNYSLGRDCVRDLYTNVGAGYYEAVVEPRVQQVFKSETVKYRTIDVAPAREEIRRNVQRALDAQLDGYCVNVADFLIDNLGFAQEFTKAIERKQVATQDALAAREKVAQAKAEADQKVEAARGVAEQTIIQARADAQANRLRQQSLTPLLVEWERIQRWQPQVIYLPADANLFVPGRTP